MLRTAYEDVRNSLRLIVRYRTVAVTVFLSLALGIGASTSMFGVVDAFMVRPFRIPETDRVVRITSVNQSNGLAGISYPDFDDLQKRATMFESLATARTQGAAISHSTGKSRITVGLVVSGDFFHVLRLAPALGRVFRPEEDQVPARDAVAMISYGMWQKDFGGSPDVLGKTIRVARTQFTVIGVVPQSFTGVNPMIHPEFYVPRMMAEVFAEAGTNPLTDRRLRNLDVYGRLKPGVTIEDARGEVNRLATQLQTENPATNREQSMTVFSQAGFRMAEDPGNFTAAMLFLFVGLLVLAIACVNVVNLLLSTAPSRTRETALRLALGASRTRLIRQFIVESCILAAAAATVGLVLAGFVARFVSSIEISSGFLPISIEMEVDARVAVFAFAVGIIAGTISSLIPALRCSRGDLNQIMRSTDPRTGSSRMRFRQGLVAAQVAVATVVLLITGLVVQSFSLLRKSDPGFRVENVITMAFDPTMGGSLPPAQTNRFYENLRQRVRALPGVQAVGLGHHVPLGISDSSTDIAITGYDIPGGERYVPVLSSVITEGYFDVLGIPLVRGRTFDARDTGDSPRVVVINEAMAEKYWPGRSPIGGRIEIRGRTAPAEVIGVVRTTKYRELLEPNFPFMYLPLAQSQETFMWLFAATESDAASLIPAIRDVVRETDPGQPIYSVGTLADIVRRQALWGDRLAAQIATSASAVGLFLGVLGLYGILAYSVSQRAREIGIRMAVGATRGRVYRLIVLHGLKLSAAGIVAGFILGGALASSVPEMSAPADPEDPIVYGIVMAVLVAVSLVSCYYPARRAARIDPNECLRCE
jgi:predicted permease